MNKRQTEPGGRGTVDAASDSHLHLQRRGTIVEFPDRTRAAEHGGNTFEYCVNALAGDPAAREGVLDQARQLMTWRRLPDGRRNFLYQPVRYRPAPDGSTTRVRRGCCMRYLASGLGYCSNCPLAVEDTPPRADVSG